MKANEYKKLHLSLKKDVYEGLKKASERKGMTMTSLVHWAICKYLIDFERRK